MDEINEDAITSNEEEHEEGSEDDKRPEIPEESLKTDERRE